MALPDIQEAQALLARDAAAEAVRVLEDLVALYPRYAAAQVLLARAYEAAGAWERATATWQDVGLLVPESRAVYAGMQRSIQAAQTSRASPAEPEPAGNVASPFLEMEAPAERDLEPSGESPVEQPPVEDPPVEQPPVEEPPAEEPPDERPPVEDPPAEEPPVEQPPVEAPPVEKSPAAQPPIEQPPVEESPVEAPPAEAPPAEAPPAEHQPIDERAFEAPRSQAPAVEKEEAQEASSSAEAATGRRTSDEPAWLRGLDDFAPSFQPDDPQPDAVEPAEQSGDSTPDAPMPERRGAGRADGAAGPARGEAGERRAPQQNLAEFDDLDRLIDELEGARIVPRPDFESIPPPDLDDEIDDMVSETLARIYATQRQYIDAARVYEALARQQPGRADEFLEQAARMRSRAEKS